MKTEKNSIPHQWGIEIELDRVRTAAKILAIGAVRASAKAVDPEATDCLQAQKA